MSNHRPIDRLLFNEYALIPQGERPIVGSNDWFRWLEEFQQRHPDEVSRLTQPLAERARQVVESAVTDTLPDGNYELLVNRERTRFSRDAGRFQSRPY